MNRDPAAAGAGNGGPTGIARWWVYQRERFPLLGHGPLVLAFAFCAASYSSHLRGAGWPEAGAVAVAFVSCLCFFLQLRIADEFKDHAEDRRWRPYRPVPRGLVGLGELAAVFALAAGVQLALALWWSPWQVLVLLGAWAYLAAMSLEFGAREWLKARPVTYLWTHMLIMPIVDFYAMASDWMPAAGAPPPGLWAFLVASFFNGIVIEFGRKIRGPENEEEGVETYSRLWGPGRAAMLWWGAVVATAAFAVLAGHRLGVAGPMAGVLAVGVAATFAVAWRHRRRPSRKGGELIEVAAGCWTLLFYAGLGTMPWLVDFFAGGGSR